MPKLREALKQTSGVDTGGNEFTLTETDIQPYIDNPEMAQMEADVSQARYGGTPIQGSELSRDQMLGRDPKFQDPALNAGRPPADLSRRGDFENSVFKQLQSENMPDGNPFNFNTTASLNAISKTDLPELFTSVFQNQVTWQDRHLLDDDQKKFWMSEVKRYRAHLGSSLTAERETAVNAYNQMMNQFDNAAKEQAAAGKLKRQKAKDLSTAMTEASERKSKKQTLEQANLKRRTQLLTDERKLTQAVFEATINNTLTDAESKAFAKELKGMRAERQVIEAELKTKEISKPRSSVTDVSTDTGEEGSKSPTVVRKKVPSGQKTIVKTGKYKGRKVVKYSDGSMAYADEIK